MIYGYARVSTDGQSVDAQVRQLTKAGCKKVFRETASGAKTDRAQPSALTGTDPPSLMKVDPASAHGFVLRRPDQPIPGIHGGKYSFVGLEYHSSVPTCVPQNLSSVGDREPALDLVR